MTYFYLYIFLIFSFFALSEILGANPKLLKIYRGLSIFMIIFIAGFRYETGVDWAAYQDYFETIPSFDDSFRSNNFSNVFMTLDLGYSLLNSVIKMFGGSIQTVFLIVSVISTTLLHKNLKFYTKYVLTGFLIYYSYFFFVFDMSGLRQGLALQILFFSYRYIITKDFKKFCWFVILAGSIHWTAFIFILLYFIVQRDWKKLAPFIIIISLLFFTFQFKWLKSILDQLNVMLKSYSLISGKIGAYTTNDTLSQSRTWSLFSIYNCLRIIIIYFVYLNFRIKEKKYYVFFNFLMIEFICFFLLAELTEISERFRFYFAIAEIVLIGAFFELQKVHFKRHLLYLFVFFIAFVNSYAFFLNGPGTIAYQPYQNYIYYKIFEKKSTGVERLIQHRNMFEK